MMSPGASAEPDRWFDRLETRLNACSLETFAPIPDGDGPGGGEAVPLVIGCYQLNERSDEGASADAAVEKSSRSGELRLHMISPTTSAPSFGEASCVVEMESGVLDGKWRRRGRAQRATTTENETTPLFASACASGRIHLHSLERTDANENSWSLSHVAASESSAEDRASLCLSLAWNDFIDASDGPSSDQIVSSYSDGTVALHSVSCAESESGGETNSIGIEETQRWKAHAMFGCPSEVWTCSFLRGDKNVVMSGADDCSLKIWDIRQTLRPTHKVGESEFGAGVTAISAHPSLSHIFAVGSYDEYVRIYDRRKMDRPLSKVHVGGGVWRIKWHPSCLDREAASRGKILVAAMHGGCRVVDVPALDAHPEGEVDGAEMRILSKFTAHESMAYGADWVSFGESTVEAAASCSFYDRQAFLWE